MYYKVNKADFKELMHNTADRKARFEDYRKYEACVKALNTAGRYHIDDVVKEFGYARVCQAFACAILASPYRYDAYAISAAQQIQGPLVTPRHWAELHPCIMQDAFICLIRLHCEYLDHTKN